MKNIALTAAAILVATTSAFAGSDHFGSHAVNQTAVDTTTTAASIRKPDMVRHGMQATMKSDAEEPGQGIWGN
ncbi:DUF680 domain-containing protein [Mesorhizobium qingshengii]|uniref:DUF680 domain-containing protein n=1 Tax=Mesorhizobium qingshengii TaxID=1165689 RepID=A0ABT4R1X1_9HYPH|nr:DUF680 domain-containing protein [Mesorhizobium qingshengii]MCZ8547827.1 DUF680 domain-containing protein [Mesorhizobium qingshengii]